VVRSATNGSENFMRLPRPFIIAAAIALTAVAIVGFGGPLSDSGQREDATAPQNIVLTAATADATLLSQGGLSPLGPIPCLDGSTVDFGQFCPVPTVQCADGTSVFIGQFCPVFKPQQTPPAPPPAAPAQAPTTKVIPVPPNKRGAEGQAITLPDGQVEYVCPSGYHYEGYCAENGPIVN
jgi:hypothetical protein